MAWRSDREPHNLLYEVVQKGLSDGECAEELSRWAKAVFGLTACHPAGTDENGHPRKDLWAPPEGFAPAPPEEKNPLLKLLMDVSESQESLLEDHILLANRINLHRCSDYCSKTPKPSLSRVQKGNRTCRMGFGTFNTPGRELREKPALVKDLNGSNRLEMERDHPMLVQH